MEPLMHWIRDTPLGAAMRGSELLFPLCEMAHFAGLCLLLGAMTVVDLRLLGLFRQTSYASVMKLLPLAVAGFAINLVTGVCFIASNPDLYLTNPAFFAKVALIGLVGLAAVWFALAERAKVAALPNEAAAPAAVKLIAAASLTMWMLVLLLGRLLPTFATTGGG